MNNQKWNLPTRFLHLGLVATVTAQLFSSLVMVPPDEKGTQLAKASFEVHEVLGLTALFIVVAHWLWSLKTASSGSLKHLFPWFGKARQQVKKDISDLLHGEFPDTKQKGGLAGLIHGLGLLAVTAIAITGGALFILFPEHGEPGQLAEAFAEVHEGLATLVWTYWAGHGAIGILHHLKGHDTLRNMFSFRKPKDRVIKKLHENTKAW
ncbi:MAG: cytochrome b/b6 domain-containing protein [Gammaproteobacteria bacterium]|nr:cytochrome b/b6 domain-containing protein [Gammaproteobacteria bacterium]